MTGIDRTNEDGDFFDFTSVCYKYMQLRKWKESVQWSIVSFAFTVGVLVLVCQHGHIIDKY